MSIMHKRLLTYLLTCLQSHRQSRIFSLLQLAVRAANSAENALLQVVNDGQRAAGEGR